MALAVISKAEGPIAIGDYSCAFASFVVKHKAKGRIAAGDYSCIRGKKKPPKAVKKGGHGCTNKSFAFCGLPKNQGPFIPLSAISKAEGPFAAGLPE